MNDKSNYSPLQKFLEPDVLSNLWSAVLLWKIKSNVKPAVLEVIDSSQYGAIPKLSMALV